MFEYVVALGAMMAGLYVGLRREIRAIRPQKRAPQKRPQGKEYVYVLMNPAYKYGLFKIGLTTRSVDVRAKELSTTGVPDPFVTCLILECDDCKKLEAELHHRFQTRRHNPRREFFRLTRKDLEHIIRGYNSDITCINQVAISDALGEPQGGPGDE